MFLTNSFPGSTNLRKGRNHMLKRGDEGMFSGKEIVMREKKKILPCYLLILNTRKHMVLYHFITRKKKLIHMQYLKKNPVHWIQ